MTPTRAKRTGTVLDMAVQYGTRIASSDRSYAQGTWSSKVDRNELHESPAGYMATQATIGTTYGSSLEIEHKPIWPSSKRSGHGLHCALVGA